VKGEGNTHCHIHKDQKVEEVVNEERKVEALRIMRRRPTKRLTKTSPTFYISGKI